MHIVSGPLECRLEFIRCPKDSMNLVKSKSHQDLLPMDYTNRIPFSAISNTRQLVRHPTSNCILQVICNLCLLCVCLFVFLRVGRLYSVN